MNLLGRKLLPLILALTLVSPGFASSHHSDGSRSSRSSSSRSGYSSRGTGSKSSSTTVSGYTKRNGTHVNSYHRTTPDSTQRNNYSAKGNVNPYTGKKGTKKVDH